MVKSIISYLKTAKAKLEFWITARKILALGYTHTVSDIADKSIMFAFEDGKAALLNMNHDKMGYSIEATVLFSSDVLSLKTMSDISNIVFMHKCSNSGVRAATDNRVRTNLCYNIGGYPTISRIKEAVSNLSLCLITLEMYLVERINRLDHDAYDLSMFETIDTNALNLQLMGEQKEYVHGSWDAFTNSINNEYSSFTNHPHAIDMLTKIAACKSFEEVNDSLISEVGDLILDDIVLNRQLHEISKTTYGIN